MDTSIKPMETTQVIGYDVKNRRSLNEILQAEPNNPNWIDTTTLNENFSRVQQEMVGRGHYNFKEKPDLNIMPARLLYFGLK